MKAKAKIEDIVEHMEFQIDEWRNLLNIETGKVVSVSTDELAAAEDGEPFDHLPQWQKEQRMEAMEVVENFEDYRELPTKFDINEYDIMKDFCFSITNEEQKSDLLRAIRGSGAFRSFKDTIAEWGLNDQWYSYRTEKFKQIAIEWCRGNEISYV
ncbi:hypothetical protein FZC79_05575 [Rossellomorea vietnamensis]|uniref:Uncharacterized protein n=2 Tax=Rossellomorea TaxID=2837508 RepID=A0A5D4KGG4_9BACI|nr:MULTISPECIES: UPF0158 family protein [Rossellomorea]TYR76358.1 hypothetical protein FZC79_05575 [Rossellomorea vietnamensis]TYS76299.1 hypothetical protein FZC80_15285 [Rossellomorea aquimaris]